MISRAKKSPAEIRREDISMSDSDIFKRYFGIDTFPCTCTSLLRDDDKNPSFSITEKDGRIYWKDYGTGEYGTTIDLLSRLWHTDYTETLSKIKSDTNATLPKFDILRRYHGRTHLAKTISIEVKTRPWQSWDVEFWESFGISKQFAQWCNVYPISHAFFTKTDKDGQKFSYSTPMDKYAYAYFEWKDGVQSIKLYQPYSKELKWLSKHDSSVWDLWKHAFKWADERSNEAVIITSSRKDAMCIWNNLGIPAMSLQGEGYIPKPQVMKQVLSKFKKVYLWYDNDFKHTNDNPGQDHAKALIEKYPQLINICIPAEYEAKDPSDFYKFYSKEEFINLWNKLKTKT